MKYRRRSIRLKGYDYTQAGMYFVTICIRNRECVFGEVVDGKIRLNTSGEIIKKEWLKTPIVRTNVRLDAFVVMPNHFHAIVSITEGRRGVLQYAPTGRQSLLRSPSQTIGAIVRGFKSVTTKRINKLHGTSGVPLWQRNYYEHVIRDEESLHRIREYILTHALRWELDRENPQRTGKDEFDQWLTTFKTRSPAETHLKMRL